MVCSVTGIVSPAIGAAASRCGHGARGSDRQAAASAWIRLPPFVIVWLSDFTNT